MADRKRHAEQVRRLADTGTVSRDTGEALTFPDRATHDAVFNKYRINSKDEGEARRGLAKFQRSSEYKRFSPYRKRLY